LGCIFSFIHKKLLILGKEKRKTTSLTKGGQFEPTSGNPRENYPILLTQDPFFKSKKNYKYDIFRSYISRYFNFYFS